MNPTGDARNPVEAPAEEFLDRKRRGEQPALREYVERYPELAGEIRDLFPALLMIEDLGESSDGTTGSLAADPSTPRPQGCFHHGSDRRSLIRRSGPAPGRAARGSLCEIFRTAVRRGMRSSARFSSTPQAALAGHADSRSTRLYNRRRRKVTRNIVERISI
jgi:hypothetical protein